MKVYFFIFLIISIFSGENFSQTSEYGNLKIYTRETSLSSIGYYSASHLLPKDFGRLDYQGISYTSDYDISSIGYIVLNDNAEIRFTLDGLFKFGIAYGNKKLENDTELFPNKNLKYYLVDFDFFTLSLNPEFTFIFSDGYAATVHIGFDLVNLGGKVGVFETNMEDLPDYSFAVVNIIPLAFRPAAYFDFGRAGLGVGALINMINVLGFRYTSEKLYPDDKWGIKTFDDFFRRFEFQIIFTF